MKLLIASDIHGDLNSLQSLLKIGLNEEGCDRILLLGDLLYHGPRNDLPQSYDPKGVISLLNEHADRILAVRGNCDSEVDQMVLTFPILADYAYLSLDGLSVLATHGHIFNTDNPPKLRPREILLHGHTHIPTAEAFGNDNYYLNPGSVAIPKGGFSKTYMIYENRCFTVKDLNGKVIFNKHF